MCKPSSPRLATTTRYFASVSVRSITPRTAGSSSTTKTRSPLSDGGEGVTTERHASSIGGGDVGVLHGSRSFILQNADGQTRESHSISAGLDYPGVGPEHSWLHELGRARYESVTDDEAMQAFRLLCRTEGIIPAIESAHALAGALREGRRLGPDGLILVNLSGRGDKDVDTAARYFDLVDSDGAAHTDEVVQ